MTKFWRKYFTRTTITTIKSYSDLYREIIIFSRQDWLWLMALLAFAYFAWYSINYFTTTPNSFSIEFISYYLIRSIVSYAMIFLIFFLAYSATQNPSRTVPEIIAHMLVFYPKPYQNELGLDYEDIQQLKRISEIEQSSADWRSSYINFVIVSFMAIIVANFNYIWNYFIYPSFEQIILGNSNLPSTDLGIDLPQQTQLESTMGAIFVIVAVLWLLYKWLSYFREFISSEYANRALLLACEELSSIYRIRNLPQDQRMLFRERRAVLEMFDYHLIAYEKANLSHKQWAPMDLKENGLWILIPPSKYSIESQIGAIYTYIKNKISRRTKPKR